MMRLIALLFVLPAAVDACDAMAVCQCTSGCTVGGISMSDYVVCDASEAAAAAEKAKKMAEDMQSWDADKQKTFACDSLKCNMYCTNANCPDLVALAKDGCEAGAKMIDCDVNCSGATSNKALSALALLAAVSAFFRA